MISLTAYTLVLRIPDWFPGASWKRLGIKLRERVDRLGIEPYEYVKAAMVRYDGIVFLYNRSLHCNFSRLLVMPQRASYPK